jgi:hypothetical protein
VSDKASFLRLVRVYQSTQHNLLMAPELRIAIPFEHNRSAPLSGFASYHNGVQSGDYPRFGR